LKDWAKRECRLLCSLQEGFSPALLGFLGLTWDDDLKNFQKSNLFPQENFLQENLEADDSDASRESRVQRISSGISGENLSQNFLHGEESRASANFLQQTFF